MLAAGLPLTPFSGDFPGKLLHPNKTSDSGIACLALKDSNNMHRGRGLGLTAFSFPQSKT